MFVKKQIQTYTPEQIEFEGAILLSVEEAQSWLTEKEREYENYWWLRTPERYGRACFVFYDGYVSQSGNYTDDLNDIRPALKIKNIGNLKVGDIFKIGEYNFKIISPELAWLYHQDIGTDIFDKETNVYENSYIKKVVDKWYENEILGYTERDLEN